MAGRSCRDIIAFWCVGELAIAMSLKFVVSFPCWIRQSSRLCRFSISAVLTRIWHNLSVASIISVLVYIMCGVHLFVLFVAADEAFEDVD